MGLRSVYENYKEHGLKYFTLKRAWVFIRSLWWKLVGYRLNQKHARAFAEIVTYKSLTCPDCVELGHCRVCKCPIDELFVAMDVGCSDGKFPEFTGNGKHWSENWEEYKEKEGIHLMKMYM